MPPLVTSPAEVEAEAPVDRLAAFLADVANFGTIAVPVESMAGDPDALWALAGEAEAAGLVDRWPDAKGGPCVVLSALSVARLGLRPTEDGERWLQPGEREPIYKRRHPVTEDEADGIAFGYANAPDPDAMEGADAAALNELADRLVDGVARDRAQILEMREQDGREYAAQRRQAEATARRERRELVESIRRLPAAERAARLRAMEDRQGEERWAVLEDRMFSPPVAPTPLVLPKLPQVRELVGLSLQWPPRVGEGHRWRPWMPGDGPCPACAGRDLPTLAVCLICHRAGLDDRLPPVEADMIPRAPDSDRRPVGRPRKAAAVAASREAARPRGGALKSLLRGGV